MKDKGYRTGIVDLSKSELSSNGDLLTREKETNKASEILKLDLRENLGIEDANISNNLENRKKVVGMLRKYRPKMVAMPYRIDRHPDHENSYKLVREAIFLSGLVKFETEHKAYRPDIVINYMLHTEFDPTFIVDISKYFKLKEEAVAAYKSQFYSNSERQMLTYISSKNFGDILHTRFKYYGLKIKTQYGEPYFISSSIRIDDPISFFDYVVF
jgi:bacillithiol biosynthesis deacetylase BshB1